MPASRPRSSSPSLLSSSRPRALAVRLTALTPRLTRADAFHSAQGGACTLVRLPLTQQTLPELLRSRGRCGASSRLARTRRSFTGSRWARPSLRPSLCAWPAVTCACSLSQCQGALHYEPRRHERRRARSAAVRCLINRLVLVPRIPDSYLSSPIARLSSRLTPAHACTTVPSRRSAASRRLDRQTLSLKVSLLLCALSDSHRARLVRAAPLERAHALARSSHRSRARVERGLCRVLRHCVSESWASAADRRATSWSGPR